MDSVIYLSILFAVMTWRGVSIEPEWVVLALLLIAVAMGRGKTFLADWLPFLLLFFAYEAMRGFASRPSFAPHDLSGMERALFGGTLPTLTLQHQFYDPSRQLARPRRDVVLLHALPAADRGRLHLLGAQPRSLPPLYCGAAAHVLHLVHHIPVLAVRAAVV
jgi:hypothetical protein